MRVLAWITLGKKQLFFRKNWKFHSNSETQLSFFCWLCHVWTMRWNIFLYFSIEPFTFFFRNLHKSDDSRQPLSPRSPKDKVKKNLRGQMSKVRKKNMFPFMYICDTWSNYWSSLDYLFLRSTIFERNWIKIILKNTTLTGSIFRMATNVHQIWRRGYIINFLIINYMFFLLPPNKKSSWV